MKERKRGHCAAIPISLDRASTMNSAGRGPSPRSNGASSPGATGDMSEYISLKEVARRSSMSEKSIRNFIRNGALPHYRNSTTGKIWLRWIEFTAWMERRRIELRQDDGLLGVLRDMKRAGVARKWA